MSGLKKSDVLSDEAIKAPLELSDNLNVLLKTVKDTVTEVQKLSKSFSSGVESTKAKDTEKLTQSQKELAKITQQIAVATARQNEKYDEQNKKLVELRTKQQQRNKELKDEAKQALGLSGAYDKLQKQLSETTKKYKDLAAQGKANTNQGKQLLATQQKLDAQLKKIDKTVGQSSRNVGNYSSVWGKLGTMLTGGTIIAGLTAAGAKLAAMTKEINAARKEVIQLTGATGRAADIITAKVTATAKVFDKDYNEVLRAANAVSKEFGITMIDAIEQVNDGFATGTDINGEYLDSLREYSAQAASAGMSAEQLNELLSVSLKEGIYSDKGIDVIKEATLRIREMPKATQAALDGIGLSSKEITKALRDGSKSVFDVIKDVSKQLDTLPPQSKAVGTAIADIFGGPGEDAGLRYIKLLQNVGDGMGDISEEARKYEELSRKQLEAQEGLNEQLVEFSQIWSGLGKTVGTFLTNAGAKLLEFTNAVLDNFRDSNVAIQQYKQGIESLTLSQLKEELKELEEGPSLFQRLGAGLFGMAGQADLAVKETEKLAEVLKRIKDIESGTVTDPAVVAKTKAKKVTGGGGILPSEAIKPKSGTTETIAPTFAESEKPDFIAIDVDMLAKELEEGYELQKQYEEQLNEMKKEKAQERMEIASELAGQLAQIGNTLWDLQTEQRNMEIEQIEGNAARQIAAAEGNSQKQQVIQEKADRKTAALRRKQAEANKRQALFNAIINTAQAVLQALGGMPPPLSYVMAAVSAALGAVQIASIASQPIPKFEKGTSATPSTFIAGDGKPGKQRELVLHGNKAFLAEKDTLFTGMQGAQVLNNARTEEILGNMEDARLLGNILPEKREQKKDDYLAREIIKGNRELITTIKNKPSVEVHGRIDYIADRRENMKRQFIEDNYKG